MQQCFPSGRTYSIVILPTDRIGCSPSVLCVRICTACLPCVCVCLRLSFAHPQNRPNSYQSHAHTSFLYISHRFHGSMFAALHQNTSNFQHSLNKYSYRIGGSLFLAIATIVRASSFKRNIVIIIVVRCCCCCFVYYCYIHRYYIQHIFQNTKTLTLSYR